MNSKKIRKSIGRFFGWIGLITCSSVIRFLDSKRIYAYARKISTLGYIIAAKQRKIALESLKLAFGVSLTGEQIEQIARECFDNMAKSGVELLFLLDKPQLLRQRVKIVGKENLEAALSKGKGVILVSGHFGNFPLMLARIGLEGYQVSGIMRHMRDKRVEKMFLEKREHFNIKTIYSQPRKQCVEKTIRYLRNNELVFIPMDQNFGTAGVFVDFFGRKAATATGPIILAERTKAAILPCFIVRQSDDAHKIIFETEFNLVQKDNNQEKLVFNIQKITDIIEAYIRKYPAQWGWIHRRWKSRPSQGPIVGG
ncbi:MAG: hypothetical protein DRP74_00910 [Candidatus Omnitrophota bacterium]|nr:MAG: hypothetical protein DRP74_00910 [Candidatus Omnitrophota bacterium]